MTINPLVSICIITYNSAKTIVETLDSVATQTYKNLELVVSDDCSQDNTVEVCKKWSVEHPEINIQIVITAKNTGVSGNLNRSVKAAKGEWVKIMAGDDILFENSIHRFLDYVFTHNREVCVSKLHFFGTNIDNIEFKKQHYEKYYKKYSKLNPKEQYKLMLVDCVLPMPGFFISKRLFAEIGYVNECYPFAEEWPTYLTLMKKGHDIPYFEEELVGYRCEGNTLGSDQNNRLNGRVFEDTLKSFKEIRRPLMLQNGLYLQAWNCTLSIYIVNQTYYAGRNSKLYLILFYSLHLFNPLKYSIAIRKLFRSCFRFIK